MDNNSNMLQLCRLCLVKDDVNIPIFEEQGDIRQIFLKISSCLPVKVSRDDRLPKKICDGCSYKLDMLYEFWNTSANAEKQLLTWLGEAGMTSQMADGTISAVAQQIKPADTFVKQETVDPPDIHSDDDDKDYVYKDKDKQEEKSKNNVDEPPPKRARRTAAVKAAIAMDQDSDDDDSGEPMTKIEDDSDDSDNDDHEPAFVDVPSTSADDQPGPSGVGKDGVEAPSNDPLDEGRPPLPTQINKNCTVCASGGSNLRSHLKKVIPRVMYYCFMCKKTSNDIHEHDVRSGIKCAFCLTDLQEENKTAHFCFHRVAEEVVLQTDNTLKCKICDLKFEKDTLVDHMNKCCVLYPRMQGYMQGGPRLLQIALKEGTITKMEMAYLCNTCKCSFNLGTISEHIKSCGRIYKCVHCNISFPNAKDLKEHFTNIKYSAIHFCFKCVRSCHLEHTKECNGYMKSFCTVCHASIIPTQLTSHSCFHLFSNEELANYRIKDDFLYTVCVHCDRKVPREYLKQHINYKHLDRLKDYPCLICEQSFNNHTELKAHEKQHTDLLCYICGKNNVKNYAAHLQRHREDELICNKCGKKFTRLPNLVAHDLVHVEQGSHACDVCKKLFKTKFNLKVHKRIHDKIKPFECSVCQKTFQTKQAKDKHLATHQA